MFEPSAEVAPVTRTAPAAADTALSDATRQRILDSDAPNTTRAYTRWLEEFTAWCTDHGRSPLPATPETAAEFTSHLVDAGLGPASIEQALAAIRTWHRNAGLKGQPDTEGARRVLRTHRRQLAANGRRTHKATPVLVDALREMVGTCDPTTLAGLRNRAILVLGLAMMGRRSELAELDLRDVTETPDGLLVYVRSSKTDQNAEGAEVPVPCGTNPDTDPVRVVRAWTDALAARGVHTGRLFRSITRHGTVRSSLSTDAINQIVKTAARRAGLSAADGYSGHSLRAGGATSAARAGAPLTAIAGQGRWSEKSPVVAGYIRSVEQWTDNPMNGIGL